MAALPVWGAREPTDPVWSDVTITLQRALELPVLRDAVVDGSALKTRQSRVVRWASALAHEQLDEARDHELILTDSAIGGSAEGFRHKLGRLAERDVSAVVLRLADTETHLPGHVAAAAARAGLPVLAVENSVPLRELADSVNRAIAADGTSTRAVLERVDRQLHDVLAAGAGLSGLIEEASRIIGGPVALLTPLRRVVAASGFEPTRDPRDLVADAGASKVEVEILDRVWAVLYTGPATEVSRPEHAAMMATLPRLIAIEVLQFSELMTADERIRREFLIDMLVGTVRTPREFTLRAAFAGFTPDPAAHLIGMAMPLGIDEGGSGERSTGRGRSSPPVRASEPGSSDAGSSSAHRTPPSALPPLSCRASTTTTGLSVRWLPWDLQLTITAMRDGRSTKHGTP